MGKKSDLLGVGVKLFTSVVPTPMPIKAALTFGVVVAKRHSRLSKMGALASLANKEAPVRDTPSAALPRKKADFKAMRRSSAAAAQSELHHGADLTSTPGPSRDTPATGHAISGGFKPHKPDGTAGEVQSGNPFERFAAGQSSPEPASVAPSLRRSFREAMRPALKQVRQALSSSFATLDRHIDHVEQMAKEAKIQLEAQFKGHPAQTEIMKLVETGWRGFLDVCASSRQRLDEARREFNATDAWRAHEREEVRGSPAAG